MQHLSQNQLIILRSKLLSEKKSLVQDLISEEEILLDTHKSYTEDLGEMAFNHLDKDIILTLSTQQRKTLKSIDTALTKMCSGNYGLCKVCQNHIQYERLEILPFTDVCAHHTY